MSHPILFAAALSAVAATPAAAAPAVQLLGAVQAASAAPADPPKRSAVLSNTNARFQQIDTNKDGSVTKAEIEAFQSLVQQRATAARTQRLAEEFARLDTDKNSQLSLAEFRAGARPVRLDPNASTEAMQSLDTNKDGKISAEEYARPILARFDRIDTNKDGTISAAERQAAERGGGR